MKVKKLISNLAKQISDHNVGIDMRFVAEETSYVHVSNMQDFPEKLLKKIRRDKKYAAFCKARMKSFLLIGAANMYDSIRLPVGFDKKLVKILKPYVEKLERKAIIAQNPEAAFPFPTAASAQGSKPKGKKAHTVHIAPSTEAKTASA